jgi:hypothetical protein
MAPTRKNWLCDFGRILIANRGRELPVKSGSAWIVGRCAIHVDAERERVPRAVRIHAVEEPRNGGGGHLAQHSNDFEYVATEDSPHVAAESVMRWVKSLEGD